MIPKKILLLFMIILSSLNTISQGMCSTACNICSHTTFIPRSMAQNDVLELALHNYYTYHMPCCTECPPWMSVQVTAPYYFQSNNSEKLAEYFLPKCQECITIGQNNTSDISSPWLNILAPASSPFSSTLCLRPTRTVVGGAIRLFFDFSSWIEYNDFWCTNLWASIFIPIQRVRHNLHLQEMPGVGSGTPLVPPSFANVIAALNNPAWNFGKLSPKALTKSGVDDICIKIGFDFAKDATKHAGFYALAFVPTGAGPKAEFLFEPLVGTKHAGVGVGFNADALIYDCDSKNIDVMIDARYAHFFKHHELRSIDLFNGDWSRYIPVVAATDTATPLPGINFFTQNVEVYPHAMFEVWAAISFNRCNWHFEVGYDFWLRAKEKIKLADKDFGVGLWDIAFNPILACPESAHCARICQAVVGADGPVSDTVFTTVKNSRQVNNAGSTLDANTCNGISCSQTNQCSYLNLDSAAHPRALSSTLYAAISWDGCLCCEYPMMIGVGGQYEFAHRKSALAQYGVWLKTAISF